MSSTSNAGTGGFEEDDDDTLIYEKPQTREECIAENNSIEQQCNVQTRGAFRQQIEGVCSTMGEASGGLSGLFSVTMSYNSYQVCYDVADARQNESLAICRSNTHQLNKLCPAR